MGTILPTKEYLESLNIPPMPRELDDEELLRVHLLCSLLCCPKQIDDEGNVKAELANRNAQVISQGCLSLHTIARAATKGDVVEAEKIGKNLERLFHHPLFADIVEMNESSAKFRAIPPEVLRPLYERICHGGRLIREREGRKEADKQKENSKPENVYRAKVACNFLMELISRVQYSQQQSNVPWPLVQKRYEEMVAGTDKKDQDLMDSYKGLDLSEPILNSKVVKKLTGRSSITKGLNQAIFHRIYFDASSGVLMVGLEENASLYSEEELRKAATACEASVKPSNPIKTVREEVKSNQFADTASWRSRESKDPRRFDADEPQYIPSSHPPQDDSDSEYSAEHNESDGVYTDEEEDVLATKTFHASPAEQEEKYSISRRDLSVDVPKFADVDNSIETRLIHQECNEDGVPALMKPAGVCAQGNISFLRKTGPSNRFNVQQQNPSANQRHFTAFDAWKASSRHEKQEGQYGLNMKNLGNIPERMSKRNELCDQRRNTGFQENDFRDSNKQYEEVPRGHQSVKHRLQPPSKIDRQGFYSGNNSPARLHQSRNLPHLGFGNFNGQLSRSATSSAFDRTVDENYTKGDCRLQHLRDSVNEEKNITGTSYGMASGEFGDVYTGDEDVRKHRVVDYDSDRFYSEEASALANVGPYREDSSRQRVRNRFFADVTADSEMHNHFSQNMLPRPTTLTPDEAACLHMIRNYAYLHRDAKTYGFRSLERILSLFPIKREPDYWVRLIRTYVREIDVASFNETIVIVWRGNGNSSSMF